MRTSLSTIALGLECRPPASFDDYGQNAVSVVVEELLAEHQSRSRIEKEEYQDLISRLKSQLDTKMTSDQAAIDEVCCNCIFNQDIDQIATSIRS